MRILMMKKILTIVSTVLLLAFVLNGCSTKSGNGEEKDITLAGWIAVSVFVATYIPLMVKFFSVISEKEGES